MKQSSNSSPLSMLAGTPAQQRFDSNLELAIPLRRIEELLLELADAGPVPKQVSRLLDVVRAMPCGLSHWPNRPRRFDIWKSEVVRWLIEQPLVLQWLFNVVYERGLIEFDPATRTWRGASVKATTVTCTKGAATISNMNPALAAPQQRKGQMKTEPHEGKPSNEGYRAYDVKGRWRSAVEEQDAWHLLTGRASLHEDALVILMSAPVLPREPMDFHITLIPTYESPLASPPPPAAAPI